LRDNRKGNFLKMKKILFIRRFLGSAAFGLGSTALGSVSFQVGGGIQQADVVVEGSATSKVPFKGPTKFFGAHLQPIQSLPMGIGIVGSQTSLLSSSLSGGSIGLQVNSISLEGSTWAKAGPIAFFLRGGRVLGSSVVATRTSFDSQVFEYRDIHGSFGGAASVSSHISLLLELRQSFGGTLDPLYGGEIISKPKNFKSSSIILGVEFGV
jgi:hypothetical protein